MAEKACDGGRVFELGDMAECVECGTRVRWDLQADPFWGFQHCRDKTPTADAVGLSVEDCTDRQRALNRRRT